MFNLDLTFEEILEDIFSLNQDNNEIKVTKFCSDVLNNLY
jgi:hypothetical protein